jgi:Mg-chelatase subunit ChlD
MNGKLPGDTVEGTDPVGFSLEFVTRMRREKGLSHVPSLRTAIAIPRFLTARLTRTGKLSPGDYLDAAVLNTPYEDQKKAWEIAHQIVFPSEARKPVEATPVEATVTTTAPAQPKDATRSILDDLEALDVDLDALDDLSSLDALLGQAEDQQVFSAFDLVEQLATASSPADAAAGRLLHRYGGGGELQSQGIRTKEDAMSLVRDLLRSRVGALDGDEIADACTAGFGTVLRAEVRAPWELAGALAGTNDYTGLEAHLQDILAHGTAVDIGRTLRYLEPHAGVVTGSEMEAFRAVGKARVRDLAEHAELLDGLRRWLPPDPAIVKQSAIDNPQRALAAARWIDGTFPENLQARVFDHWADARTSEPTLHELLDLVVPCPRWTELVKRAWAAWARNLDEPTVLAGDALRTAQRLAAIDTTETTGLAGMTVVYALEAIVSRVVFLPLLDAFLDAGIFPVDPQRVVAAGVRLGLSEEEILERLGRPLDQLQAMIAGDMDDAERYQRLVEKISRIPPEILAKMVERCVGADNLCGMAACLAIDMAGAAALAPADFVTNATGHKGIGGGTNLLKQWFDARDRLDSGLRSRIKELAKQALVALAFHWASKGAGSTEQGMVPQQRSRPFRGGDDLDSLDIESTLDAIISAGKPIDQVTEEDLYVPTTARGKAGMAVLIDISGSMGGRELANCAIAVVMLLGRLAPEEVAIALFESDTHVLKGFHSDRDLDTIADEILDLRATGGTRVDRALQWVAEQFDEVPEAELRMLFLLSDYCFFESKDELRARLSHLAGQDVRLLGAAHGSIDKDTAAVFQSSMVGEWVPLRDLDRVPALLQDAVTRIGNGW